MSMAFLGWSGAGARGGNGNRQGFADPATRRCRASSVSKLARAPSA
jgi:hypothetical protein